MVTTTTTTALQLSPKDQKEQLWNALMEHNLRKEKEKYQNNDNRVLTDDDNNNQQESTLSETSETTVGSSSSSSSATSGSDVNNNDNDNNSNDKNEKSQRHPHSHHHEHRSEGFKREWPSYDAIAKHCALSDLGQSLKCPMDYLHSPSTSTTEQSSLSPYKYICPHGVVCMATMEFFEHVPIGVQPYTGLFTPGITQEHCILRLSSGGLPPSCPRERWVRALLSTMSDRIRNAKLFPGAAIKVFRNGGMPSGNILFMGSKIGQTSMDYFQHCQCTNMTEKMPRAILPFIRNFWNHSKYPLALGLSDFATYDNDGNKGQYINFPYALIIKPRVNQPKPATTPASNKSSNKVQQHTTGEEAFDGFLDYILDVPVGTVLFDIYACPNPISANDPSKLQRIGQIKTSSRIIPSLPNDGLFFRHQRKEDDLELRPHWKKIILEKKITIIDDIDDMDNNDNGKKKKTNKPKTTIGTIGKLTGWKLFEQHINKGQYKDFEKKE